MDSPAEPSSPVPWSEEKMFPNQCANSCCVGALSSRLPFTCVQFILCPWNRFRSLNSVFFCCSVRWFRFRRKNWRVFFCIFFEIGFLSSFVLVIFRCCTITFSKSQSFVGFLLRSSARPDCTMMDCHHLIPMVSTVSLFVFGVFCPSPLPLTWTHRRLHDGRILNPKHL